MCTSIFGILFYVSGCWSWRILNLERAWFLIAQASCAAYPQEPEAAVKLERNQAGHDPAGVFLWGSCSISPNCGDLYRNRSRGTGYCNHTGYMQGAERATYRSNSGKEFHCKQVLQRDQWREKMSNWDKAKHFLLDDSQLDICLLSGTHHSSLQLHYIWNTVVI